MKSEWAGLKDLHFPSSVHLHEGGSGAYTSKHIAEKRIKISISFPIANIKNQSPSQGLKKILHIESS